MKMQSMNQASKEGTVSIMSHILFLGFVAERVIFKGFLESNGGA